MESLIEKCIYQYLEEATARSLWFSREEVKRLVEEGRLKINRTPDPKMGDYGIALHILLKNTPRDQWARIGEQLLEELERLGFKQDCRIFEAKFVNGYLNVTIDYSSIISNLLKEFLEDGFRKTLSSYGGGRTIVVEHTSANPVHPLHIGSGRNSIIGDTFSRLSKKLGFNVVTRFYVNDLGRQVAVLAYGVSKLRKNNIAPPEDVKIDHWYGMVYASVNTIMMIRKLSSELGSIEEEVYNKLKLYVESNRERLKSTPLLSTHLESFISIKPFVHNSFRKLAEFSRGLRRLRSVEKDPATKSSAGEVWNLVAPLLEKFRETYKEYVSYVKAGSYLNSLNPEVYNTLSREISSYEKAEEEIKSLMWRAEHRDPEALGLIHQVSRDVLSGFMETLKIYGVFFDGFDFESSDEIVNMSQDIVEKILATGYANMVDGAVELDLNKAAQKVEFVRNLFAPDSPGRFIVRRSDGTTLYVTRDIAYSIIKFSKYNAEKVYNVIAVEQDRAQKQLRATLKILGFDREAENLVHFAYEMVQLRNMRMSGRRGIYYTMDELLVDMTRALVEKQVGQSQRKGVSKDSVTGSSYTRELAVANARALLLSVEPGKVLFFDPEKIGEFEHGVTIAYSFARLQSILRKQWGLEPLESLEEVKRRLSQEITAHGISEPATVEEKKLIEWLNAFSQTLINAYEEMKPNRLLEYAHNLALDLNRFYEKCSVIGEKDLRVKNLRLLLVFASFIALSELMEILGTPRLRRL